MVFCQGTIVVIEAFDQRDGETQLDKRPKSKVKSDTGQHSAMFDLKSSEQESIYASTALG